MGEIFRTVLNMSLTASWIVLAVVLVRLIFKKAPRYLICLLWGIVGLRLIFPFSVESIFSLLPSAEPLPKQVITGPSFDIDTGLQVIDNPVNNYLGDRYFEGVSVPANAGANLMDILSIVWLAGIAVMLLISLVSCLRLSRKVRVSLRLRDNIYLCDEIGTPFIFGIFRPKIYLPSGMEQGQIDSVIAHENAHLKRKDHLIKPLGFVLLAVYWFNPVLWAAYILLCRDIELACDEKVIRDMSDADKKTYLNTLLACSMPRYMVAACPLAFGEIGVKQRVKSILNYKKPAFWVIIAAIALCIVMSVCFLTNPADNRLTDIENRNETLFENLEKVSVTTPDGTVKYSSQYGVDAAVERLKQVKISRRKLSQSREEDRSAVIQVKLEPGNTVLCFNADCTEVWIHDGVKPSFTYAVKNPEVLTESEDFVCTVPNLETPYWSGISVTNSQTGEVLAGDSSMIGLHPDALGVDLYLSASNSMVQLYDTYTDSRWYFTYQQTDQRNDGVTYALTSTDSGHSGIAQIEPVNSAADGVSAWSMTLTIEDYCLNFQLTDSVPSDDVFDWSSFQAFEAFTCDESPDPVKPKVVLSLTENSFEFTYSALSSTIIVGTYDIIDDTLFLYAEDGTSVYRFNIPDYEPYASRYPISGFGVMYFDAENSSPIPKFRYSADSDQAESPVPDGARFYYTESRKSPSAPGMDLGKGEADIDGDGEVEYCTFRTDGTYTHMFIFTAYEKSAYPHLGNSIIKYQDGFRHNNYEYYLEQMQDGSCQLIATELNSDNIVCRYDISIETGRIELTDAETGERILHFGESGRSTAVSNTGGSSGPESIAFTSCERYYFDASPDPIQPSIVLSLTDNSFAFSYSALSSYIPHGSYEVTGDRLILRTENGKETYQFQTETAEYTTGGSRFARLIFDAASSSPIPVYRYSDDSDKTESPVPDGAVFEEVFVNRQQELGLECGRGEADVDGDGILEQCVVRVASVAGNFAFSLTASADGVIKYHNDFVSNVSEFAFGEAEDGSPQLLTKDGSYGEAEHRYTISVQNGNLVLRESKTGDRLPYLNTEWRA